MNNERRQPVDLPTRLNLVIMGLSIVVYLVSTSDQSWKLQLLLLYVATMLSYTFKARKMEGMGPLAPLYGYLAIFGVCVFLVALPPTRQLGLGNYTLLFVLFSPLPAALVARDPSLSRQKLRAVTSAAILSTTLISPLVWGR